jgi:hypothetical protein
MRTLIYFTLVLYSLFLCSCGCTNYKIRCGKLTHSATKEFSVIEVSEASRPGFNYSEGLKLYLSDTVLHVKGRGEPGKNFKFKGKNPEFTITLGTSGKEMELIKVKDYLKPGRKYLIPHLSRMHCPPVNLLFEVSARGKIHHVNRLYGLHVS